MVYSATITRTGQITLPKTIREFIGVSTGQKVIFRRERGKIILERERNAAEIASAIDALIPDDVREFHNQNYAGLTSAETKAKWSESNDATKYFREEVERTL